jgi:hypothetical protein
MNLAAFFTALGAARILLILGFAIAFLLSPHSEIPAGFRAFIALVISASIAVIYIFIPAVTDLPNPWIGQFQTGVAAAFGFTFALDYARMTKKAKFLGWIVAVLHSLILIECASFFIQEFN